MVTKLLIVEPNREERFDLITAFGNSAQPFKVWGVTSASEALQILEQESIDIVITELRLPDMSGFLFLDSIAERTRILIYSDGNEPVILRAYTYQIDDFAIKSQASIKEVVLRTKVILRRATQANQRYIQAGDICIDVTTQQVWRKGIEIKLSDQRFQFLFALASAPSQVVTRNQLADAVGSTRDNKGYRVLYVLAMTVRQRLELDPKNPRYIQNIRGIGYMLRIDRIP